MQRQKKFKNWLFNPKTLNKFKRLGFSPYNETLDILLSSSSDDYEQYVRYKGYSIPYKASLGKGHAIKTKFFDIMNNKPRRDDIIAYIDGDGREINFDEIFKIIKELKRHSFVLSCRAEMLYLGGIRETIELFENFLIEEKFGIYLPDVQCGCWGFHAHLVKKIFRGITASGFEIELDLIVNMLKNSIYPRFSRIKIKKTLNSSSEEFKPWEHFQKLRFLLLKISWGIPILKEKYQKFIIRFCKELPLEYIKLFDIPLLPLEPKVETLQRKIIKKINCSSECCKKLPKRHICRKGKYH